VRSWTGKKQADLWVPQQWNRGRGCGRSGWDPGKFTRRFPTGVLSFARPPVPQGVPVQDNELGWHQCVTRVGMRVIGTGVRQGLIHVNCNGAKTTHYRWSQNSPIICSIRTHHGAKTAPSIMRGTHGGHRDIRRKRHSHQRGW